MKLFDFKKVPVKTRVVRGLVYSFFVTFFMFCLSYFNVIDKISNSYFLFFFIGMAIFGFFWQGLSWRNHQMDS